MKIILMILIIIYLFYAMVRNMSINYFMLKCARNDEKLEVAALHWNACIAFFDIRYFFISVNKYIELYFQSFNTDKRFHMF